MVAEPLRFERLLMASNPGNPLAQKERVSISDLADQPIFLAKFDCGYRMVFEQLLTEQKVKPQTLLEFNSVVMLKACLSASHDVTLIPEVTVRDEIDREEVAVLRWAEEPLETATVIIWHKDK